MSVSDDECHIGGDRSDVGDMVVKAFQLEANSSQRARAWRRFDVGETFDGVAESRRVGKA